jgi:hypothetical protein
LNSFLLSRQKNLSAMAKKVAELFVEVLAAAGVSIFSTMLMPLPQDFCWAKLLTITPSLAASDDCLTMGRFIVRRWKRL